jgi:hypothetical protein
VWSCNGKYGLPALLKGAYIRSDDEHVPLLLSACYNVMGLYVPDGDTVALVPMLRVIVLSGAPPELLAKGLAPPLQQIVQGGARLRAQLPAFLTQRRALLDAHCPLLPTLQELMHGYDEPTTSDEFWATGLGAPCNAIRAIDPREFCLELVALRTCFLRASSMFLSCMGFASLINIIGISHNRFVCSYPSLFGVRLSINALTWGWWGKRDSIDDDNQESLHILCPLTS